MKRRMLGLATIGVFGALVMAGRGEAQCGGMHSGSHASHQATATAPDKTKDYPIDYCIVSGEKLGEMGDPVRYEYKGRTVYFCCKGCIKKFEADPAKYMAMLDAAAKPKSLDWCIVTGDKLGEMGKPVPYKYKDRELTFCCKSCIKEFEKDPTMYLARLDSALAGQITPPSDSVTTEPGHHHGDKD
ncbi:MAG TPA: YHS domain-containing protein [bacterium]|nr:YHS domain-containing protein [bacterium]